MSQLIPERIIIQHFLNALPEKYWVEKRMLAGGCFDRKALVARIRGRFEISSYPKSISGEGLVAKDQKGKKEDSGSRRRPKQNVSRTDPTVVC